MTPPILPHLPPDPAVDQCFQWLEISILIDIVLIIPIVVDLAAWAVGKWRARHDPL